MIISALFILTALAEVPVSAKVVDDFGECPDFFYKSTEPQGMDQNAVKICQQYGYAGNFYASLYSTFHRIPVYSAYTFDPDCNSEGGRKSGAWFIEPQLSGIAEDSMTPENIYDRNRIKSLQAVNGDYSHTGYDRGHLNTNSFQCAEGREATFTLTNSAPMDACFNRVNWKQWEAGVKGILRAQPAGEGTAYLVTGTVTLSDYRIPSKGEFDDDNARDFNRVTVPTNVWTAVCYQHHSDEEKSFSFAYIGLNQPDSRINVKTVPQLNHQLSTMYSSKVNIFIDDCFSTELKSQQIVKKLYMSIQLPLSDRLSMSGDVLNTFHTAMSQFDNEGLPPSKRARVTMVTIQESFDSLETWFKRIERMKYVAGLTCVLFKQFTGAIRSLSSTRIQKRDSADDSQELVCSLVPEQISECTSSCLYNKEARGYYCDTGTSVRICSPVYSVITVKGTKCNSDHTCGTHGHDYYWCYVGSSWEYCSPPLPMGKSERGRYCRADHNCARYGKGFNWCYTDYDDNWAHCCSIDDQYSALNGKTCKHDHPCGGSLFGLPWCKTVDGSWAFCCTTSE